MLLPLLPNMILTSHTHRPHLPPALNHQRRQLPTLHATTIDSHAPLRNPQPPSRIMPVNHSRALFRRQHGLVSIPQLGPRRALGATARDVVVEIDGAHVHDGGGVLHLEGEAGDEAGVDDVGRAEVGEVAEVED